MNDNNSKTLPELVSRNYRMWPDASAMCIKRLGIWQRYTWTDYYHQVKYFALGLISLGFKKGDVAAIIGDNEPEWFWGEFAIQIAGAIPTGIYVDAVPGEVKFVVNHSGASFAVVNDQEQVDKFLEIRTEIPQMKKIIYWDPKGLKNYEDPLLISFNDVIKLGRRYDLENPGHFENFMAKIEPSDTAFIYYTSGTTGQQKAAILTHKALISTALGFITRYPLDSKTDLLSNFPAAWVGDSYFATIPHLITGARLNFPEEPETIAADTREVGPHFVIYGPRQWEALVSDIQIKMMDAHPFKRLAYRLFLPVGYRVAEARLSGRQLSLFWRLLGKISDVLMFRPLKDRLGLSRVRCAVTGSSVLALDTFRLIHAIGIELRQNYASTEAGYISSHSGGDIAFESVGRPALNTEVRLTTEGELLVRSDCMFSGYYKDEAKSRECFAPGGWFRTGDAVNINEAGHIIFLDRLKDMGELSNGGKFAPQYIEGRLRFSPYIKDAMVLGDIDKEYVSAIVNIDFSMVSKWAQDEHLNFTTYVDLSQKKEVADLVAKDVNRVNGYLPEKSRVKKFAILHKEFDADEAELTRTRKLRRGAMNERYKDLIETIYGGREEVKVEAPVTYRDGRKGVVTTSIKVRQL
jgi:long-chain acyl-CoA synthetase